MNEKEKVISGLNRRPQAGKGIFSAHTAFCTKKTLRIK